LTGEGTFVTLIRSAKDVRSVRACVRDVCRVHHIAADRCADAQLAVSELVGNALRHGREPIDVDVRCSEGHVLLTVEDASSVAPRPGPEIAATQESGRGLLLIESVSDRWGCEATATGKRVWALV
jgi:anti-sigma regulatory factor (Ser/Thr protein kinase)